MPLHNRLHFRLVSHVEHALRSLILLIYLNGVGWPASSPLLCEATGYSYTRFIGPVVGPEQKVLVHDAVSGDTHVDYIAKPEYAFAYGVEDEEARVLHNRREMRDGDAVQGMYSVVDPDGTLRVVKYTADNVNGFRAEVISNGVPINHGHHAPSQNRLRPAPVQPQQVLHPYQPLDYVPKSVGTNASNKGVNAGVEAGAEAAHADEGVDDYDDESRGSDEVHAQRDSSEEQNDAARTHDDSAESSEEAYEDATKEAQSYEDSSSDDEY